jgi:CRP-like cAMP-binding protein
VILGAFDASAITYRVRFWIEDYERDEAARDQVRTAIYYAFARHGIEIPWPIQVQYERASTEPDAAARGQERAGLLAGVDLFATLSEDLKCEVAAATVSKMYGDGEAIVRQGDPGHSMFVVGSGRALVVIEPDGREVATIERGGYFGEMSLLTGEPRTATVLAKGDTFVIEVDAQLFRALGATSPQAVEQVALAAATRRAELDELHANAAGSAAPDAPASFLDRMRRFLRLA